MRAIVLGFASLVAACFSAGAADAKSASEPYTTQDARAGAQLRAEIGVVVQTLYHPCSQSEGVAPAVRRFEALRDGQTSHEGKIDFVIARADYDYQMSLVDIACPEWTDEEQRQADELNAAVANATMDRMDVVLKKLAEDAD